MKVKFLINEALNRFRLLWVKPKEDYIVIQKQLGFTPHTLEYYTVALSHKSILSKKERESKSNERLEYLGDAVIETIVSDILYKRYKEANEGELTNMRVKLVQRGTLNRVAEKMNLQKLVKSSALNKTHNFNVNGNALEALMGAIYLDKGFEFSYYYWEHYILKDYLDMSLELNSDHDYKSKLIEWCQKRHLRIDYKVVEETKDDNHNIIFKTEVTINHKHGGYGTGYSKKESQQMASRIAYYKLTEEPEFQKELKNKKGQNTEEG